MKKIVLLTLLLTACQKELMTEFYSKQDYTYVSTLKSEVRTTLKDTKQGVIDKKNKIILPNAYKSVSIIGDKILYSKDNKMGITDLKGKSLLKNEYSYVYPFQENYLIKYKEKYGVMDSNENIIIAPIYDSIKPFKENRAIVVFNNKYGVIDIFGKEIVSPKYEYIMDFSNDMAMIVKDGKKAGFLNKDGVEVVGEIFDYTQPFKGNSTMMLLDKKFGVIDKNGKYTIPLQNERINVLGEDLYSVKKDDKFYLLDMNGKNIVDKGFENIGEINEGLIPVSLNEKFGYINPLGEEIIPLVYTELGIPQDGLIIAKHEVAQKFGVINFKNEFVVKPKYSYISSINADLFIVGDENFKEGIVNREGKVILPLEFQNLEFKYDNLVAGNNEKDEYKFIKINNKGYTILDINLSEIIDYNNDEIVTQSKDGTKIYKLNREKK